MTRHMRDAVLRALLVLLVYVGLCIIIVADVKFRPTPSYEDTMWDWCRRSPDKRTHHEVYVCIEAMGKRP